MIPLKMKMISQRKSQSVIIIYGIFMSYNYHGDKVMNHDRKYCQET